MRQKYFNRPAFIFILISYKVMREHAHFFIPKIHFENMLDWIKQGL